MRSNVTLPDKKELNEEDKVKRNEMWLVQQS